MIGTLPLALAQAAAGEIGTIAWAQVVMAVAMVAFLLLAIAGAMVSYQTMRALGRLIKEMEIVMERLVPRAEPLIDGATKLTSDLAAVTQTVRGEVDRIRDTLDDVNYRVRRTADEVEDRVARFGEVLSVVQDEAEELLMTAASTARGLNAAAQVLREPEPRVRPRRDVRARRPVEPFDDEDDIE